jgi:hypothetical protein
MEDMEFVMTAKGHAGMVLSQHPRPAESMIENMTLELTSKQRELVLEGLRYVRSSRRYEFRVTSAPPDERRDGDLRVITELMGQLDPDAVKAAPAEA